MQPLSNLQVDDISSISFFACIMRECYSPAVECKLVNMNNFYGYGRVKLSSGVKGVMTLAEMREAYDLARADLQNAIDRYDSKYNGRE